MRYIEIESNLVSVIEASGNKKNKNVKLINTYFFYSPLEITNPINIVEQDDVKGHKVELIINNNSLYYRELKLPNVDDKKTLMLCRGELATAAPSADLIVDYISLDKVGNQNRVLAVGMTKDIVRYDIEKLHELKCKKINGIDVGYDALFNYVKEVEILLDNSASLLIEVNDNTIKLFLFNGSKYVLAKTTRIFNNSLFDILTTIKDEISMMRQFQMTYDQNVAISQIYLFGRTQEMQTIVEDLNNEYQSIKSELLPLLKGVKCTDDFNYLAHIYALGAMMRDN